MLLGLLLDRLPLIVSLGFKTHQGLGQLGGLIFELAELAACLLLLLDRQLFHLLVGLNQLCLGNLVSLLQLLNFFALLLEVRLRAVQLCLEMGNKKQDQGNTIEQRDKIK